MALHPQINCLNVQPSFSLSAYSGTATVFNNTPLEKTPGFLFGRYLIRPFMDKVGEFVYPILENLWPSWTYDENQWDSKAMTVLKVQHAASEIRSYYVEIEENWKIYVEESGNPEGIPVVFVHGGPGARFKASDHQWFDPEKYRIIVFQQRGTYKCMPSAEDLSAKGELFKDVGIETLAKDMEVLRTHLGISKWLVFGGSWGSTLGLYYTQEYPTHCSGLVIRGIFLSSEKELTNIFTPDEIDKNAKGWNRTALDRLHEYAIERGLDSSAENMTANYRRMIVEGNDHRAACLWRSFEKYIEDNDQEQFHRIMDNSTETTGDERSVGLWETQMFHLMMAKKIDLLASTRIQKLEGIPIKIVQGSEDPICPPEVARNLADRLVSANLSVSYSLIDGGRHSPYSHPGMIDALIDATDQFAFNRQFS